MRRRSCNLKAGISWRKTAPPLAAWVVHYNHDVSFEASAACAPPHPAVVSSTMSAGKIVLIVVGILIAGLVIVGMSVAGIYNRLVTLEQGTDAAWAQVQNVYQRRADLIPNLVNTVSGA